MKRKKSMLELMRDVCPKKGSSISSVTISIGGGESVTLTSETRDLIDKRIKEGGKEK